MSVDLASIVVEAPQGLMTLSVTPTTSVCQAGQPVPPTSLVPGQVVKVRYTTDPTTGSTAAVTVRVVDACRE